MEHESRCQNFLATLSDYVDGALDPMLCQALEEHLDHCDNCRIVLNTLKKTVDLVHEDGKVESIPLEVRGRLFKRLDLSEPAYRGPDKHKA